ncbi:MAG: divalent metal cation transporter [Verrucomicrobiales bacterium]
MPAPDTARQRDLILDAKSRGKGATLRTYLRLSGPGWLQSAITLGGGSLAGSLYLGIIGGYELMWLQPLMMIFGIVMLSAIAHVSLSSGAHPFRALNTHVSPVLGWAWIVATVMANLVWAMPQFSLGTAALRQNLGLFTFAGGELICAALLLVVAALVVWLYDSSSRGYRVFDILLKLMVAIVVGSFFMVVVMLATSETGLPWGRILSGFIPDPGLIFRPADSLRGFVEQSSAPEYWHRAVVSAQRDRMVAAAATAVGINMTFLLPYSMMKRGWDRNFRGLARFDLATGLFIPFFFATSFVVIAAASQFHARPEAGLLLGGESVPAALVEAYRNNLAGMLEATGSDPDRATMAKLPEADRILAATLIKRDAFALANSLQEFAGGRGAQLVFGFGVVGMALSSIIILMLINGFAVCEMLNRPLHGWTYRLGCLLPACSGALGALFLWSGKAQFYLAVPTSRFGMVLLPIAYIAFFCLMNSRTLLGDDLPKGKARIAWNTLMGLAILLALTGAAISILNDTDHIPGTAIPIRNVALLVLAALALLATILHFTRDQRTNPPRSNP